MGQAPMAANMNEGIKRQNASVWFIPAVAFSFFVLYAITAQRGVSWQDSGEYQYRVLAGDYQWHSGIARSHPFYILMARIFSVNFPTPSRFYAVNLFSGLGLSLSLAVLARNVVLLTRSSWAAVFAVVLLGFAHMAWWLGTVAEVYTWSLAFLMIEVYCLIRFAEKAEGRWLLALFGVNGLHFGIHNAALLGMPVYVFLLASEMRRLRGRCAGVVCGSLVFWLVGGGLVIGQAVRVLHETGEPYHVVKSVLFGEGYARYILGTDGGGARLWLANMALAGISFANPGWLFAWRGLLFRDETKRKSLRGWLLGLTVLHGFFWIRYCVPDQATFVLPTLGLLALWAGIGAGRGPLFKDCEGALVATKVPLKFLRVRQNGYRLTVIVLTAASAVAVPWLINGAVRLSGIDVGRSRALPFRDESRYWLLPWKQGEDSAARFASAVGEQLASGDVLFADATSASPLMATRQAGVLKGEWRLITPWSGETGEVLSELLRNKARRVYVVSPVKGYVPGVLLEDAKKVVREGVLFRVYGNKDNQVIE